MNELKLIIDRRKPGGGGYSIYEFNPSPRRLFYKKMGNSSIQNRIRFLLEFVKGYKVYYLIIEKNIVAYCVISKGGGRYSFARKEDIVVGPYFVEKEERGKHYSEILVSELVLYDGIQYNDAYDWIRKTNIPSLRCSDNVGFKIIGTADVVKPFRRILLRKDGSGEYYILKGNRSDFLQKHRTDFS